MGVKQKNMKIGLKGLVDLISPPIYQSIIDFICVNTTNNNPSCEGLGQQEIERWRNLSIIIIDKNYYLSSCCFSLFFKASDVIFFISSTLNSDKALMRSDAVVCNSCSCLSIFLPNAFGSGLK